MLHFVVFSSLGEVNKKTMKTQRCIEDTFFFKYILSLYFDYQKMHYNFLFYKYVFIKRMCDMLSYMIECFFLFNFEWRKWIDIWTELWLYFFHYKALKQQNEINAHILSCFFCFIFPFFVNNSVNSYYVKFILFL